MENILDDLTLSLEQNRDTDGEKEEDRLDNLDQDLLDSLDVMGRSLSELAPELKKRALDMASKLILQFIQGGVNGIHPLPTYQSSTIRDNENIVDLDLERTLD